MAPTVVVKQQTKGCQSEAARIAWVDCARGWCILLVVLMHSTLGVGYAVGATGWLHAIVAFAKPFRMPDFFMVAGLFAAASIDGAWCRFFDRKVIHFAYFYGLWLLIELAVKSHDLGIATPLAFVQEYVWHLIEPFSSMWFIQLLPVLYLATRLCRFLPVPIVLSSAIVLHFVAAAVPGGGIYAMESHLTGFTTINSFLLFWIYFLTGHYFKRYLFSLSDFAASHAVLIILMLGAWTGFQALATHFHWPDIYGLDLPFGLLGAGAVIVLASLLGELQFMSWLGVLGRNSLVIYICFFLPMASTRTAVLSLMPNADLGLLTLIVTFAGVVGPLILQRLARCWGITFFFDRPAWARLHGEGGDSRVLRRIALSEVRRTRPDVKWRRLTIDGSA